MDTYRIGTLLELARHLAFRVIEGTGRKVRICVQAPMGEGFFGRPIVERRAQALEMMDWGARCRIAAEKFIRFGAVGSEGHADDEVFVVLAPQSIVGNS